MSKVRSLKLGDLVFHASKPSGEKYVVVGVTSSNISVYYNKSHYNYPPTSLILVEDDSPTYPNPPHKHAELIKAWADGAEIQIEVYNKKGDWYEQPEPEWCTRRVYRIKPTKSAKDIKLEELEANMRKLADEIKELRDE